MKNDDYKDCLIWALAGNQLEGNEEIQRALDALLEMQAASRGGKHEWFDLLQQTIADLNLCLDEGVELDGVRSNLDELLKALGFNENALNDPLIGPRSVVGQVDDDLLQMFLQSCSDNLEDIEQIMLRSEDGPLHSEDLDELRRVIHTFKGECGVLSLHTAQELCHEAESMMERVIEASSELPNEVLFRLVDWCREYIDSLAHDPQQLPPDGTQLVADLQSYSGAEPMPMGTRQAGSERSGSATSVNTLVEFPPDLQDDDTLPEFLSEAMQHLEDAEAALLALDDNHQDNDSIDCIFRAFHTIKGVGGFLGLDSICSLAHSSESLLDCFRQGELEFGPAYGDLILQAKDLMAQLLLALAGSAEVSQQVLSEMIQRLDEALSGDELEPGANLGTVLEEAFAEPAKHAVESGHRVEANAVNSPTFRRIGELLVGKGLISAKDLEQALSRQAKILRTGKSIRLGDLLVESGMVTREQVEEVMGSDGQGGAKTQTMLNKPAVPPVPPRTSVALNSTIKVNTQRLDTLVDLVGELVISQQMVLQDPEIEGLQGEQLRRNLSLLTKITRDLQEASMSLRMVTFKSTFQKMHRLVRDVSSKSGKPCRLVIEGADTEVDRNLVEKIGDPLVHLLRNAVDHGVEDAAGRAAAGKPAEGTIRLAAIHQSGSIIISITDDGKGLDREVILRKAREKNLLASGCDPNLMRDEDVFQLIFQAGFSTAAQVTDISGRGVGMDVVRRNIESMRGRVEIQSAPGKGSTFHVHLPLTLAIIDAMVVRCGGERYVLPTLSIVQSFRPKTGELQGVANGITMVDLRGRLVPVRQLEDVLYDRCLPVEGGKATLILVESNYRVVCLGVDEILGQQQVVIKNLGKGVPNLPCVSGGAILGDGRVALIIDVDELVSETHSAPIA